MNEKKVLWEPQNLSPAQTVYKNQFEKANLFISVNIAEQNNEDIFSFNP